MINTIPQEGLDLNPQSNINYNQPITTTGYTYYEPVYKPTFDNLDILQEAIKVANSEHFGSAKEKADFVIETYKKFKKALYDI